MIFTPRFRPFRATTYLLILLVLAEASLLTLLGQQHTSNHSRPIGEQALLGQSPTQPASLITGLEGVSQPITTTSTNAQKFFNQGLAFLLSDWPQEAERSFRTASLHDPDALMPIWGIALSLLLRTPEEALPWIYELEDAEQSQLTAIEKTLLSVIPPDSLVEKKNPSQWQAFLIKELKQVIEKFPKNTEPRALLAAILSGPLYHQMEKLGESPDTILEHLNKIIDLSPNHPAHRIGLQLWSHGLRHDPYKTPKTYFDLKTISPSPAIPQQWSILSRYLAERDHYPEALGASTMAMRIQHQWQSVRSTHPDQIPDHAHLMATQARLMRYLGNPEASLGIAHELLRLPRHPYINHATNQFGSAFIGRKLILEDGLHFGLWQELRNALSDGRVTPLNTTLSRAEHAFAQGVTSWFLNHEADFSKANARLESIRNTAHEEFLQSPAANTSSDKKPSDAHHSGIHQWLLDGGETYLSIRDWSHSLKALALHKQGQQKQAEELLQSCRWTPHLLRSRLLWSIGSHRSARQAILNAPDLPLALRTKAIQASQSAKRNFPLQPALNEKAIERSRLGTSLESMGIPTWRPHPLPTIDIPLIGGGNLNNKKIEGEHSLIIWIFNSRCAHCVEQLEALRAASNELKAASLSVYVVASQPRESLQEWIRTQDPFPFQFAYDPKETSFKAVQAYDHFESNPLHATIYVDPSGKQAWQDQGDSPFMDITFLIQETLRLRQLP